MRSNVDGFEATELWSVFHRHATAAQEATVRRLIGDASALLARVGDTFPTYTLHDHVHAENVVRLMGSLLGPRCEQLSALEAAVLLLAAYWHDVGMVFSEAQRAELADEDAFGEFLREHPQAFLAVEASGDGVPTEVAEWYCRWRHAERVYDQLDALEPGRLAWESLSLRDAVGLVCRSHGLPTAQLHDSAFQTNFGAACDLRFCAILLRAADILDFDRSRSPEALVRYLGLEHDGSPRVAASAREWAKHHCSDGFVFPAHRDGTSYPLEFVAGPTDPAIEYDLRQFLDAIEEELRACRAMLPSCSPRWADFVLPERIDRGTIQSQGYRYGEHRFTLEREDVLALFMGESLYESPFAFVRELLQNALDASRHREFFERSTGDQDFVAPPVRVTEWIDPDGVRWIRFEDEGMGMNEAIVKEHFLKVGSSYYRSPAFRADVVRYARSGGEFLPISRFGIGLLSCFVLGDRVEVSTKQRAAPETSEAPVRLSLASLEGFYTLQLPPLAASSMPGPGGPEPGYRPRPGTTVAVRIDPRKESEGTDLEKLLRAVLACPPIPVMLDGELLCDAEGAIVEQPWSERLVVDFDAEQVPLVEEVLDASLPDGLQLHVLPLDLTAMSPSPLLRGQMLMSFVTGGPALGEALRGPGNRGLMVDLDENRANVSVWYSHEPTRERGERRQASIEFELPLPHGRRAAGQQSLVLSHNGIRLPRRMRTHEDVDPADSVLKLPDYPFTTEAASITWHGRLALSDRFRPDVSVSRDEVRALPWEVHSAGHLALHRAVRSAALDALPSGDFELFSTAPFDRRLLLGDVIDDPLLTSPDGWCAEPIFGTDHGVLSLTELRERVAAGTPVGFDYRAGLFPLVERDVDYSFLHPCRGALLDLHLSLTLRPGRSFTTFATAREAGNPRLGAGLLLFPPLSFIPYEDESRHLLKALWSPVNAEHPLARWLLEVAPALSERFPGILASIRGALVGERSYARDNRFQRLAAALERLRTLDPDLAPPRSLKLTPRDFGAGD